jgi:general secretion pathway protein L
MRADSVLAFQVLDARRRIERRAAAVIASLPRGMGCELVLHALDAVLLEVQLPRLSGAKLAAALPALVEERIAGDVEQAHVVAGAPDANGRAVAVVVDRALFARALGLFARAGYAVEAVTPRPLALPVARGRWRVLVEPGQGCVRTDVHSGLGFSWSGGEPPVELRLLVAQGAVPETIDVEGEVDTVAWSAAVGATVNAVMPASDAPPVVVDLLQYEFAPSVTNWSMWRPALASSAALFLVVVAGLNLHAWRLKAQETALRDRMVAVVKEAIPSLPVVLDPLAQMQRHLADLRTRAGVGRGEFFMLASTLARAADQDSVQAIEYRDGQLTVKFQQGVADDESRRGEFVRKAREAGISAVFGGDSVRLAMESRQ